MKTHLSNTVYLLSLIISFSAFGGGFGQEMARTESSQRYARSEHYSTWNCEPGYRDSLLPVLQNWRSQFESFEPEYSNSQEQRGRLRLSLKLITHMEDVLNGKNQSNFVEAVCDQKGMVATLGGLRIQHDGKAAYIDYLLSGPDAFLGRQKGGGSAWMREALQLSEINGIRIVTAIPGGSPSIFLKFGFVCYALGFAESCIKEL